MFGLFIKNEIAVSHGKCDKNCHSVLLLFIFIDLILMPFFKNLPIPHQ